MPLHDYVQVIIYRVEHVCKWTGDATNMPARIKNEKEEVDGEHEKLQMKKNRGVFMVRLAWPKSFSGGSHFLVFRPSRGGKDFQHL